MVKVALRPVNTSIGIVSASYEPVMGKVALGLEDGRKLSLTAGRHIEETEEW